MAKYRWRLEALVTCEDKAGVLELARQRETSPAVVVQCAIRKLLADAEMAVPFVGPAVPLDDARLVVNVTHGDFSGLMELARKARTTASALLHLAICKALANPDDMPGLRPACDLVEVSPSLVLEWAGVAAAVDYGDD